jgi:hypothetical protein
MSRRPLITTPWVQITQIELDAKNAEIHDYAVKLNTVLRWIDEDMRRIKRYLPYRCFEDNGYFLPPLDSQPHIVCGIVSEGITYTESERNNPTRSRYARFVDAPEGVDLHTVFDIAAEFPALRYPLLGRVRNLFQNMDTPTIYYDELVTMQQGYQLHLAQLQGAGGDTAEEGGWSFIWTRLGDDGVTIESNGTFGDQMPDVEYVNKNIFWDKANDQWGCLLEMDKKNQNGDTIFVLYELPDFYQGTGVGASSVES